MFVQKVRGYDYDRDSVLLKPGASYLNIILGVGVMAGWQGEHL